MHDLNNKLVKKENMQQNSMMYAVIDAIKYVCIDFFMNGNLSTSNRA